MTGDSFFGVSCQEVRLCLPIRSAFCIGGASRAIQKRYLSGEGLMAAQGELVHGNLRPLLHYANSCKQALTLTTDVQKLLNDEIESNPKRFSGPVSGCIGRCVWASACLTCACGMADNLLHVCIIRHTVSAYVAFCTPRKQQWESTQAGDKGICNRGLYMQLFT